jgi:hypothetical protein
MRTKGNEALRTLGTLRDKVGIGEEERRLGAFSQLNNWGSKQSTPQVIHKIGDSTEIFWFKNYYIPTPRKSIDILAYSPLLK